MIFAIEPVYRHIVWNPVRARIVLDAIDSPNLQIIFDAVNLLNPDNYDRKQDVIREAIEVFGRDVAMIHLKDCLPGDPGTQNVKSVPCGKGELDYTDILRFARDRKPWIQATLEDTKPDNAVAAREFIEGKMASL